jgi:hypothetical protein
MVLSCPVASYRRKIDIVQSLPVTARISQPHSGALFLTGIPILRSTLRGGVHHTNSRPSITKLIRRLGEFFDISPVPPLGNYKNTMYVCPPIKHVSIQNYVSLPNKEDSGLIENKGTGFLE